jgi:mannose-6-phosphate isomerase-like protein (cupin superfamily)
VGYRVVRTDEHDWVERPGQDGAGPRHTADVTSAAALSESRARLWRLPPGSRGRRHKELAQEEVFVVLDGTLTMLLGDPPERVEVTPRSIVSVEPGTGIQLRNESDGEVMLFAYGAPPVTGQVEYLDDVEL